MNQRYGSPDKHARVEAYMASSGMQKSLMYQDNDITYSLVDTKPQNRACFAKSDLKKETWKPKTTLKWHEPYRAPLTLQ